MTADLPVRRLRDFPNLRRSVGLAAVALALFGPVYWVLVGGWWGLAAFVVLAVWLTGDVYRLARNWRDRTGPVWGRSRLERPLP